MTYKERLQRAIDHIELHAEGRLTLDELAFVACYSRSHFTWLFECATGRSPMDYARKRRLARAAEAIQSGAPIMDTALRFGFSSQDAFTRSFHNELGVTPARHRRGAAGGRKPQPVIRLLEGGERMNLRHLVASCAGSARVLIEHYLTDDVKSVVSAVAVRPPKTSDLDPEAVHELTAMNVLREDKGSVKLATSVFLEADMKLVRDEVDALSAAAADAVQAEGRPLLEASPDVRCYVACILGLGRSLASGLLDGKSPDWWKHREGKYGHARVDFDEVCDAYDGYGPDLLMINTNRGETYSVVIVGPGRNNFLGYQREWLTAAVDEDAYRYAAGVTKHLTDAFAMLARSSGAGGALLESAAAARLASGGVVKAAFIERSEAESYTPIIAGIAAAVERVGKRAAPRVRDLLRKTTSGRQGVSADEQVVNFARYVRKLTARRLYDSGFLTDEIPASGAITVFYESSCSAVDIMR